MIYIGLTSIEYYDFFSVNIEAERGETFFSKADDQWKTDITKTNDTNNKFIIFNIV